MSELPAGLNIPIPNEGRTAKVVFGKDSVILTPSMSSNRDRLNNKIQNEKQFSKLTESVPGLHHPKILHEDTQAGRYEIERAKGFNLTAMRGEVLGGGFVDFFHISAEFKAEAMLTYLRAIDSVNQAGYCFVDHKSDSVFIDPQNKQVSIVDADALTTQTSGAWQKELDGGLQEVLQSFFTRSIKTSDSLRVIPAGAALVINDLANYKSAHEAVEALEGWMHGEKTIDYVDLGITNTRSQFNLIVRPLKSPEMQAKLDSIDFSRTTDYQRDMLEAEIYTAALLKSEEPQAIDKYSLGIRK